MAKLLVFFFLCLSWLSLVIRGQQLYQISSTKPDVLAAMSDTDFKQLVSMMQTWKITYYMAEYRKEDPNCQWSPTELDKLVMPLDYFFNMQLYSKQDCPYEFRIILVPEYSVTKGIRLEDVGSAYHRNLSEAFSLTDWQEDKRFRLFSDAIMMDAVSSTYTDFINALVGVFTYKTDTPTEYMTRPWKKRFEHVRIGLSLLVPGYTFAVCPYGTYAVAPVKQILGFAIEKPVCKACDIGTWNTCRLTSSCNFHVIQAEEKYERWVARIRTEYKDDINTPVFSKEYNLVGSCYPCKEAMGVGFHFGAVYNQPYDSSAKTMPFFCPGGGNEPRKCPDNSESFFDSRGWATGCTCKGGSYDPNKNSPTTEKTNMICKTCDAGYYCFNGDMFICPVGTYSTAGASACTPCMTDPCPVLSRQLRPVCKAGSTKDELFCVDCDKCSNLGSTLVGAKQCILQYT